MGCRRCGCVLVDQDGNPFAGSGSVSDPFVIDQTGTYAPETVVAAPTGVAATDTANFLAALTAWAARGGRLRAAAPGVYALNAPLAVVLGAHMYDLDLADNILSFTLAEPVAPAGGEAGAFDLTHIATTVLKMANVAVEMATPATTTGIRNGVYVHPAAPAVTKAARVEMTNVTADGFSRFGIAVYGAAGGFMMGCAAINNKNDGCQLVGCSNFMVVGGDYSDNISTTHTADRGLLFSSGPGTAAWGGAVFPTNTNLTAIGVAANRNGRKGLDVHACIGGLFIGCTVDGFGYNASASTPAGIYAVAEDSFKLVRDITITQCRVDGGLGRAVAGPAIQVGAFGTDSPVASGVFRVTDNDIKNMDGFASDRSVLINNPATGVAPDKVIVSGNTCERAAGSTSVAIGSDNAAVPCGTIEVDDNILHFVGTATRAVLIQLATVGRARGNVVICDHATPPTDGVHNVATVADTSGNVFKGTAPTTKIVSGNSAILDYIGSAKASGLKVLTGTVVVTVVNPNRVASTTVTFPGSFTFAAAPLVIVTGQDVSASFSGAELPVVASIDQTTTTTFIVRVDTAGVVGGNRPLTVAWVAIGT